MEPRSRSDPGFGMPPRYPGTFLLAFREALEGLSWKAQRWLGEAVVCLDASGSERLVGLENLYRRMRGSDRAGWPTAIGEFLNTALGSNPEELVPTSLVEAASQVLLRLGPPLRPQPDDAGLWGQPLEDTGLVMNLVIDFPDRMVYVSEAMITESGTSGDEWKTRALANLRRETPDDCFQVVHDESGLVRCQVADAYDSSRALLLDELLPDSKERGCFVALPNRDHLFVLPVSRQSLAFVHLLKVVAMRHFQREPYPISPEVFWVHQGLWRHFRINVQGERAVLEPPAALAELMPDLLSPDPETGAEG